MRNDRLYSSLDATACGTPVVNIRFDAREISDFAYSIERFYLPDFVRELTETGATWVAKNKEDYINILHRILEDGEKKNDASRTFLIKQFMYALDGKSAKRIADVLAGMART